MHVAIAAKGTTLSSQMDPRFGRAERFLIVDTESSEFFAHDNTGSAQAASGVGVQAGKAVVDLGVEALITGNMGPKAFRVLQAGGVEVYAGVAGTVQDALRMLTEGKLEPVLQPNVPGHWSPAKS